jgi:hypothetical protein
MQHPMTTARRTKAPTIEPMTIPAIAPPLSPRLLPPAVAAPLVALGVLELVDDGNMLPNDVVIGSLTLEHLVSVLE